MAEPYTFQSSAGVRRDGTDLDSPYYQDVVWTRFQRGRPTKIGGFKSMSRLANGPVRHVHVDSRTGVNSAHYMSKWGVQRQEFSPSGAGGALVDRTPLSFTPAECTWTSSILYSTTGGSLTNIFTAATPDLYDLASDTAGSVFMGNITTNDLMTALADGSGAITTSGGIVSLQPFLFVYGSNGLIRNSNANDVSAATGWTVGGANFANQANPCGTKIVYGAPVRGGGQSPAGLFWSLDSVIRVTFNGTAGTLWNYDTISSPTTILSKKCVVEVDGKFFWIGSDKFMVYNGVVQELPNEMNINWFFDNLNAANYNKVWGTKIPRWGEIWWFFPRGQATECDAAVIYNYRENTWYDAVASRAAGSAPTGTVRFPIWVGQEDARTTTRLVTGTRLTTSGSNAAAQPVITTTNTTNAAIGQLVTANVPGVVAGSLINAVTPGVSITLNNNLTAIVAAGSIVTCQSMLLPFSIGNTISGGTSLASGDVVRVEETAVNLTNVAGTFVVGETITATPGGRTAKIMSTGSTIVTQELDTIFQHEFGKDKIVDTDVSAVVASFTSRNFGFAVGDPFEDTPKSLDAQTVVSRVEPDFNPTGDIVISFIGRDFAQDQAEVIGESQIVTSESSFVDFRDVQARIISMVVTSDTLGGSFYMGQVLVHMDVGNGRSGKQT